MKLLKNVVFIMIFAFICSENNASEAVNRMTTMVQGITAKVRNLRDRIASIDPEKDIQRADEAIAEITNLEQPLHDLKLFVQAEKRRNPDIINQLNTEGMPPRIVEEEVELCFRHDLDALGMSLGIGSSGDNYDIWKLGNDEWAIYSMIENLSGPTMMFKNLSNRYKNYLEFVAENKRYSPQEAHVILHIANYVIAVRESLALAEKDAGRYLLNLLKTYVDWLPEATHFRENVEIIMQHGSLISVTDKNNKTMLDWTNTLIDQVKQKSEALRARNISTMYMNDALKQLQEIAMMLKGIIRTETGKRKLATRDPLSLRKAFNPAAIPGYESPLTEEEKRNIDRLKALNPSTEKKLIDVSYKAQESYPR
jgi:hypothetical protein